jgi:protein required for attachment to host cells
MEPKTDIHEVQRDAFAREIAQMLNLAGHNNEFDALVLAAPPAFLGDLRKHLSDAVAGRVSGELDKNLTSAAERELPGRLQEVLHFAETSAE